jgi:GNAT superfamily N-acetyltransferase
MEIRRYKESDHKGVLEVAESLPEWFDADARARAIPTDLRHQVVYVASESGKIIGFISLYVAEGRVFIGWLGELRSRRGSGIGKKLLGAAEQFGWKSGLNEIATHTLGDSVNYLPYEYTRAFDFTQGFKVYQRAQTDNKGCPEELKIKKPIAQQGAQPDAFGAG